MFLFVKTSAFILLDILKIRTIGQECNILILSKRLYPALLVFQDSWTAFSSRGASGRAPSRPVSPPVGFTVPNELPPAYTPQPTDGHLSLSHGANRPFPDAPHQASRRQAAAPVNLREAGMEIMFLPSGVQMFFVSAEGRVTAPSYPGYLRIIIYSQDSDGSVNTGYAPAYLQVNTSTNTEVNI